MTEVMINRSSSLINSVVILDTLMYNPEPHYIGRSQMYFAIYFSMPYGVVPYYGPDYFTVKISQLTLTKSEPGSTFGKIQISELPQRTCEGLFRDVLDDDTLKRIQSDKFL
mmetsp:Transcript_15820/g.18305  ORF Transcript_15820/g.18305 Transcript_15820/m.18305 type:complete len:111 (+) Transcript_15820:208-540(+)